MEITATHIKTDNAIKSLDAIAHAGDRILVATSLSDHIVWAGTVKAGKVITGGEVGAAALHSMATG